MGFWGDPEESSGNRSLKTAQGSQTGESSPQIPAIAKLTGAGSKGKRRFWVTSVGNRHCRSPMKSISSLLPFPGLDEDAFGAWPSVSSDLAFVSARSALGGKGS